MAPASQNNAELIRYFLVFGRSGHFALLRLAGDLRRRRRRGHFLEVREVIVDPSIPSDHAAVAGAAGEKPVKSLGKFVGRRYCAGLRPDKDSEFNALIMC